MISFVESDVVDEYLEKIGAGLGDGDYPIVVQVCSGAVMGKAQIGEIMTVITWDGWFVPDDAEPEVIAEELCEPGEECPDCGESDYNNLVWTDTEASEFIICVTCGRAYLPDMTHYFVD